jgi:hypothetical protein
VDGKILGPVTVSAYGDRATGAAVQDGDKIDVDLGNQVWIQRGANYKLTAGGNAWQAMCVGGGGDDPHYYFLTIR